MKWLCATLTLLAVAPTTGWAVYGRGAILPHRASTSGNFFERLAAANSRTLLACAADDEEDLKALLKAAVEREDYKTAATLKAQLDAAPVNMEKYTRVSNP